MNNEQGVGVRLRRGRWLEWLSAPMALTMEDGRVTQIEPGDMVLMGRDYQGDWTRLLWYKKRQVH